MAAVKQSSYAGNEYFQGLANAAALESGLTQADINAVKHATASGYYTNIAGSVFATTAGALTQRAKRVSGNTSLGAVPAGSAFTDVSGLTRRKADRPFADRPLT